jgi:cupin superfamily acireductone dioxygenase involved in methionine salvage
MKASYYSHRDNAKRRGIPFELTFEQFEAFAIKYDLVINSGTKKHSLTIDRIRHDKGYTKDNIQVLSLSENSIKGNLEKKRKYIEGTGLRVVKIDKYQPQHNEPF